MSPFSGDDDEAPRRQPGSVRPMTPIGAFLWTTATTFAFVWVYSLTDWVRPGAETDHVNKFACQILVYTAALFGILRLYAPDSSIRELIGLRAAHPAFYALGPLVGLAVTPPSNAIYAWMVHRFPDEEADSQLVEVFRSATPGRLAMLGVFFVVIGPLVEELFFRGALFRPLRERMPLVGVALVTGSLFAMAHFDYRLFVPIGLVGVCLGLVRGQSRSIVPGMLLHMAYNALPYWGLVEIARGAPDTDEPVPVVYSVGGAVAVVGLLWLGHWLSRRLATSESASV